MSDKIWKIRDLSSLGWAPNNYRLHHWLLRIAKIEVKSRVKSNQLRLVGLFLLRSSRLDSFPVLSSLVFSSLLSFSRLFFSHFLLLCRRATQRRPKVFHCDGPPDAPPPNACCWCCWCEAGKCEPPEFQRFDIGDCGVGCGDPNFGGVDRAAVPLISDASLMVGNEPDGCQRECADDGPSPPPPERQLLEYWNEAAEVDALAAALAESGDVGVSCTRPPSGPMRPPRGASPIGPIGPIGAPVSCGWPRPAECCRSGDRERERPGAPLLLTDDEKRWLYWYSIQVDERQQNSNDENLLSRQLNTCNINFVHIN